MHTVQPLTTQRTLYHGTEHCWVRAQDMPHFTVRHSKFTTKLGLCSTVSSVSYTKMALLYSRSTQQ